MHSHYTLTHHTTPHHHVEMHSTSNMSHSRHRSAKLKSGNNQYVCNSAPTKTISRTNFAVERSASSTSYQPVNQPVAVDDELSLRLPELFTTLANLKRDGRRPTPSAYSDILQLAARHHLYRTNPITQGREPSNSQPRDSLAWELAKAALEDANRGDIALDEAAYHHLINVS